MAYEDFSMEHYKQLYNEQSKKDEEIKRLRNQLNEKDEVISTKDDLLYKQNLRLQNMSEYASKAQQNGGMIVGLMNKFRTNE